MSAPPFDARLISAWREIPEPQRKQIKAAIKTPSAAGAYISVKGPSLQIKTPLGFVVFGSMVTGLALQMIEACEFNGEKA